MDIFHKNVYLEILKLYQLNDPEVTLLSNFFFESMIKANFIYKEEK